jgi:phosphoserine phosphatase
MKPSPLNDENHLEETVASLLSKKDRLNEELESRKIKRDRLNDSVKALQAQAKTERDERDSINSHVAEIKKMITSLRKELLEKTDEINNLDYEIKDDRKRLEAKWKLEKDLQRIEWEHATTPTLELQDREAELIEKATKFRQDLKKHEILDNKYNQYLEQLAEIKAKEVQIRGMREEMQKLHEKSQVHHERMLSFYKQSNDERKQADEAHGRFVEKLNEIKIVNSELDFLLPELKKLRTASRAAERLILKKRDDATKERQKELVKEAKRKLEAGEKLSLEELKLVYDE